MKQITLVDGSNFVFTVFFMAKAELLKTRGPEKPFNEEDIPFFYSLFIAKMNSLFSTYKNIIFAFEGENSLAWRRTFYDGYKRNRTERQKEDDMQLFFSMLPEIQKLITNYPTKVLRVKDCEADDVIYQLALKYANDNKVVIISTDKDFVQIKKNYPNVDLYNPVSKKFVDYIENIIERKAIVGDSSDGIPGLPRVGEKTFEKMMQDQKLFNEKMQGGNRILYENFLQIIDLSRIPESRKKLILEEEEEIEFSKFDADNLELFMMEKKMDRTFQRWPDNKSKILYRLNTEYGEEDYLEDIL